MELAGLKVKRYNPTLFMRFMYRFSDIIIGFIGCIATLFLLLIVKIAYIKDKDYEPIIFKQERIGLNGKLYKMYKIRTMVPNADEILFQLMESDDDVRKEYEKNKKLSNDPRITRLGQKIRTSSLDEFPQFLNVLLGNMSLVGPRPYLPREIKDMGEAYTYIIQCKPAITGPWQVGGRNDINFHDRCLIDVDYVSSKNIKEDLKIFMKTLTSVITKHGAS